MNNLKIGIFGFASVVVLAALFIWVLDVVPASAIAPDPREVEEIIFWPKADIASFVLKDGAVYSLNAVWGASESVFFWTGSSRLSDCYDRIGFYFSRGALSRSIHRVDELGAKECYYDDVVDPLLDGVSPQRFRFAGGPNFLIRGKTFGHRAPWRWVRAD